MTGEFPAALASIPRLAALMIHDTNLRSTVPLPKGPWPAIANLVVSGTGGLCGALPSVCSKEQVYCDVIIDFPPCDEAASNSSKEGSAPAPSLRSRTRPADVAALVALWEANGRQSTLIGWGEGDPCFGEAPEDQANAQGFGPWKGVGCVPCPEPEDSHYLCVSQIWQHQKNLNGTIPETFRGLTELKWLFLSANNLTGPLPEDNWVTFPKLVRLDLSYNTINGSLPLDGISRIPALERAYFNDNHFDSVSFTGGGFESLVQLDLHYNRNMTGDFPAAFASIPQLAALMIHDTNLTSTVPLPSGPWPAIENLVVSGTGGLCGPLPSVCSEEKVYCDVILDFPPCDKLEAGP